MHFNFKFHFCWCLAILLLLPFHRYPKNCLRNHFQAITEINKRMNGMRSTSQNEKTKQIWRKRTRLLMIIWGKKQFIFVENCCSIFVPGAVCKRAKECQRERGRKRKKKNNIMCTISSCTYLCFLVFSLVVWYDTPQYPSLIIIKKAFMFNMKYHFSLWSQCNFLQFSHFFFYFFPLIRWLSLALYLPFAMCLLVDVFHTYFASARCVSCFMFCWCYRVHFGEALALAEMALAHSYL